VIGAALAMASTIISACMNRPDESDETEVQDIKEEIRQYLLKNRNAQDTLRGVIEWWLLVKHKRRLVKEALDRLIEDGLVIEEKRRGSRTYKLNPLQLEE
jgi:hypothetical protein